MGAYRKQYRTQHLLICLPEEWRANLDQYKIIGAVLSDLCKACNCIPHDLSIVKLNAY